MKKHLVVGFANDVCTEDRRHILQELTNQFCELQKKEDGEYGITLDNKLVVYQWTNKDCRAYVMYCVPVL